MADSSNYLEQAKRSLGIYLDRVLTNTDYSIESARAFPTYETLTQVKEKTIKLICIPNSKWEWHRQTNLLRCKHGWTVGFNEIVEAQKLEDNLFNLMVLRWKASHKVYMKILQEARRKHASKK